MQKRNATLKFAIVIIGAAAMVGIAAAVNLNIYQQTTSGSLIKTEMSPAESDIVMKKGETKVIPIVIRTVSKESVALKIQIIDAQRRELSGLGIGAATGEPGAEFDALREIGLPTGFAGSLDREDLDIITTSGDQNVTKVNLALTTLQDVKSGDHEFAGVILASTGRYASISSSIFMVRVE